eukprot:gene10844-biopygen1087
MWGVPLREVRELVFRHQQRRAPHGSSAVGGAALDTIRQVARQQFVQDTARCRVAATRRGPLGATARAGSPSTPSCAAE